MIFHDGPRPSVTSCAAGRAGLTNLMKIFGYRLSADQWGGLLMVAGIARVAHFHFYPPQGFEHWMGNPLYYVPAGVWLALLVVVRWRWGTKAWLLFLAFPDPLAMGLLVLMTACVSGGGCP